MSNKQTSVLEMEEKTSARGPRKAAASEEAVVETPTDLSTPAMTSPVETPEAVVETRQETGRRRMPEHLRRFLVRLQGGKLYLPAAYRIVWFRDEYPDWGILTELVEGGQAAGYATVKATIYNPEGRPIASDYKTETKQDFPAGWVEKAATGAISRALSIAGFGTQFSPELDEGGPVGEPAYASRRETASDSGYRGGGDNGIREERPVTARPPAPAVTEIWEGPGQCPRCHAPEGKRHGKPCIG